MTEITLKVGDKVCANGFVPGEIVEISNDVFRADIVNIIVKTQKENEYGDLELLIIKKLVKV